MLLLDAVLSHGPGCATALVRITPDSSFYITGKGVPSYLAIEYMAQTIAVIAGKEAVEAGKAAPVGYLLGTRSFQCNTAWFPAGSELLAEASEEYVDGQGMGAYLGRVTGGDVGARCRLTVFRPGQPG